MSTTFETPSYNLPVWNTYKVSLFCRKPKNIFKTSSATTFGWKSELNQPSYAAILVPKPTSEKIFASEKNFSQWKEILLDGTSNMAAWGS